MQTLYYIVRLTHSWSLKSIRVCWGSTHYTPIRSAVVGLSRHIQISKAAGLWVLYLYLQPCRRRLLEVTDRDSAARPCIDVGLFCVVYAVERRKFGRQTSRTTLKSRSHYAQIRARTRAHTSVSTVIRIIANSDDVHTAHGHRSAPIHRVTMT